jgi:hypothetical protein
LTRIDGAFTRHETVGVEVGLEPFGQTFGEWLERPGPQLAPVETCSVRPGSGRRRHNHLILQHNNGPAIGGVEAVGADVEVVTVMGGGKTKGTRGEDCPGQVGMGGHLMNVGVDVDRGDDTSVVVTEDAADVDVDIEGVIGVYGHGADIGRGAPRGVPLVAIGGIGEELVLGERVLLKGEESCLVGAKPGGLVGRTDTVCSDVGWHPGDHISVLEDPPRNIHCPPAVVVGDDMVDPLILDQGLTREGGCPGDSSDEQFHSWKPTPRWDVSRGRLLTDLFG